MIGSCPAIPHLHSELWDQLHSPTPAVITILSLHVKPQPRPSQALLLSASVAPSELLKPGSNAPSSMKPSLTPHGLLQSSKEGEGKWREPDLGQITHLGIATDLLSDLGQVTQSF